MNRGTATVWVTEEDCQVRPASFAYHCLSCIKCVVGCRKVKKKGKLLHSAVLRAVPTRRLFVRKFPPPFLTSCSFIQLNGLGQESELTCPIFGMTAQYAE